MKHKTKMVIEGARQSGKTTILIRNVVDRLLRGMNCYVFSCNQQQVFFLHRTLSQNLPENTIKRSTKTHDPTIELINGAKAIFVSLGSNLEMKLHGRHTEDYSLFINDGDYAEELQKEVINYLSGWREVFCTRTVVENETI